MSAAVVVGVRRPCTTQATPPKTPIRTVPSNKAARTRRRNLPVEEACSSLPHSGQTVDTRPARSYPHDRQWPGSIESESQSRTAKQVTTNTIVVASQANGGACIDDANTAAPHVAIPTTRSAGARSFRARTIMGRGESTRPKTAPITSPIPAANGTSSTAIAPDMAPMMTEPARMGNALDLIGLPAPIPCSAISSRSPSPQTQSASAKRRFPPWSASAGCCRPGSTPRRRGCTSRSLSSCS